MAREAIALIIAGSGETTPEEIDDLLDDAYPEDTYEEVGLIVPVDKDLFTKSVQNVIGWFNDDKAVYAIQTEGAALSRGSSRIGDGNQKVEKFSDILTRDEFKPEEWDNVHFLVAMPEDEDDPDYDLYAEMVEVAIDNGIKVRNLTRGLDDDTLADPEPDAEPEPEPEPEPEKPARKPRSRRKAAEPEPEKDLQEQVAEAVASVKSNVDSVVPLASDPAIQKGIEPGSGVENALHTAVSEIIAALENLRDRLSPPSTASAADPGTPEPAETSKEPAAPRTGRGRPRTNFSVPQIYDEDEEEWVPRPKGRMRKGTQHRTIHAETGEVLTGPETA